MPPRGVYEDFLLVGPGSTVTYAFEVGELKGRSLKKLAGLPRCTWGIVSWLK